MESYFWRFCSDCSSATVIIGEQHDIFQRGFANDFLFSSCGFGEPNVGLWSML